MLVSALDACGGAPGQEDTINQPSGETQDEVSRADGTVMYIWASDQAHAAPDFIAVVDFNHQSHTYGQVLKTIQLPGGLKDNEPHHVGLSADGRTLAVGGLLSVLSGHPDAWFYDVSDPLNPTFIKSDDPPNATITDEFHTMANGGFMVTFMGGPNGAAPGRVVEYDSAMNRVAEWPAVPPTDGFDPHGIATNEGENLMVTSDFICPLATLHIPGGDQAHFRGKIRVWDLAGRTIIRNITIGDPGNPAGTIDVQLIPDDSQHRGYTAGMVDNGLYLFNSDTGSSNKVFDFSIFQEDPSVPVWPQLIRINEGGDRLYITLNYVGQNGKVVGFDISNRDHPRVISVQHLGSGSGPHYLRLSKTEKRLVVSDYFLVEDIGPGGIVQAEGDHKIHVFGVEGNGRLREDPQWPGLDFNTAFGSMHARPHGVIIK
jgi:hypothetical protein